MPTAGMWLQVALTSALAYLGWALSAGEYPKTRIVIAIAFAWVGTWLALKLYTFARYGWHAMRSVRWDD